MMRRVRIFLRQLLPAFKKPTQAIPELPSKESTEPANVIDVQGDLLTPEEKDQVLGLMNEIDGVPVDTVLKVLFPGADTAKRVAVSDFMTKLTRTPRAHPTDRKKLHVKTMEKHVLPVYHYKSKEDWTKNYVTFLVLGETGVGKSTLMDAFANCLGDVHYQDTWRWKLVDEDHMKGTHTSESHTTDISIYYITDLSGRGQNVRIIDTPGFGDTRGVAEDARTMEKFQTLFTEEIDEVDYILLCVKAGETRWTPANQYVYDSILQMFGKDAQERFILMCTFADAAIPKCIETLEPHMTWRKYFPFNNSALYTPAAQGNKMTKFFWDMGMSSVRDFLDFVKEEDALPLSLAQSNEVLQARKWLQASIDAGMKRIEDGFQELDSVHKVIQQIKNHEEQINQNGSFEYEEEEYYFKRVPLPNGTVYQLCSVCQVTCCQICHWPAWATESQCTYFYFGRKCPMCPGRCPKSAHVRTHEAVTKELRKVKKIWEHKKKAHEDGKVGLSLAQEALREKEETVMKIWKEVTKDIQHVQKLLADLDQKALKPRAFTNVDFFQKLIDEEKETKKPGYLDRVKDYELLLGRAKTLEKLSKAERAEDMFQDYKETMEKLIERKKQEAVKEEEVMTILKEVTTDIQSRAKALEKLSKVAERAEDMFED